MGTNPSKCVEICLDSTSYGVSKRSCSLMQERSCSQAILHFCSPPQCTIRSCNPSSTTLVLARSLLARFQLLQIPPADLHVALVIIHALGEVLRINITASRSPVALVLVSLALNAVIRRSSLSSRSRSTTEKTTDGMADRRANSNTSGSTSHLSEKTWTS